MPLCEAVLIVEQRAYDATVSERGASGRMRRRLTHPDDRLVVASAGLDCRLADIYARATLARQTT